MEALILTLFLSLVLLAGGLVLLAKAVAEGDMEHADRLSLLPLEDDPPPARRNRPALAEGKGK